MRTWLAIALVSVALLLASECSAVAQETAQNHHLTKADVTACHTFGAWDKAAHEDHVTKSGLKKMLHDLSYVREPTLRKLTKILLQDGLAQNDSGFEKQILAIAKQCEHLGLIDGNGNPT